jgi:hypothetical protein
VSLTNEALQYLAALDMLLKAGFTRDEAKGILFVMMNARRAQ